MNLTQERLKELLHYDPIAGVFTWLVSRGRTARAGHIAGHLKADGYRRIIINGKSYVESRLAFLYMEGYFPENDIDHRNRCTYDNRWKNLKHVSHLCNMRNKNIYKNNKSGITGVYWHKIAGNWRAGIRISGKAIHLGTFGLKINAIKARWEAEVRYGFPNCNTTSTAFLYLQQKGAI